MKRLLGKLLFRGTLEEPCCWQLVLVGEYFIMFLLFLGYLALENVAVVSNFFARAHTAQDGSAFLFLK